MLQVKTTYTIIISLLLISLIPLSGFSQSQAEFQLASQMMNKAPKKVEYTFAKTNTNELQMLFSGLFLGYKALISSQDGNSCTFIPSCSEYGMIAVKKKGAVIGVISTFDRLTRCNGLSPEKYARDPKTGLYIDPVQ